MIKFTIAISAYKNNFLEECIKSVLNQSFIDFELIILNDCSPFNLKQIIYSFNDKRIKYFENEINEGARNIVNNWNKCLSLASGEYFVMLGDDDKLDPNFLRAFNDEINKYCDVSVYHCRSYIIDEDSRIFSVTNSLPQYETISEYVYNRIIKKRSQFISDFVFETIKLKQNGGFYFLPLAWASDDITVYKQITELGIRHINQPLLFYRNSRFTITNTGNTEFKLEAIEGERNWFNNFITDYSPKSMIDKIHFEVIKNEYDKYFQNKYLNIIRDMVKLSSIIKYYKVTVKYSLPLIYYFEILLKKCIKAFTNRKFGC